MKVSEKVAELERENDRLRHQALYGKPALYIRLDGSTQVKPAMWGLHGPMRRVRREVLRQAQITPVMDDGRFDPRGSVPYYREEFRLIAETRAYYVYEEID